MTRVFEGKAKHRPARVLSFINRNLQGIRLIYLDARLGGGGCLGPGQGAEGKARRLIPGAAAPGESQEAGRGVDLQGRV